ncbi:MAG: spore coat protein [Christensenellales bacterium]|jgi:rubrerythrin
MNLTSKELSAIEDLISGEATTVKKFRMYAQNSTDPQIKAKYEQIAAKHQDHFNRLVSFLN